MASIAENESKAVINSNGRGGVHRLRMLNDSCLLQIFLYLSHVDEIVPRLLIVSKAWYKIIANSSYLWGTLFRKHFGSSVESYICQQGSLIAATNSNHYKFLNFCKCLRQACVLLITPEEPFFVDKQSQIEFSCDGLGILYPVIRDLEANDDNIDATWQHEFDLENLHQRGFLVHRNIFNMKMFNFDTYDFTVELWCKLDESFKNEDIMILNYNFFAENYRGMDFYLCSAWHRSKGNLREDNDTGHVFADNSCEIFNILDNPEDVHNIGVTKYNNRCDNKYHHVAYVRVNGELSLYHDGERVAVAKCPYPINPSRSNMFVGSRNNTNKYALGKLATFRIYNGIAKYHGDFFQYLPSARHKWLASGAF